MSQNELTKLCPNCDGSVAMQVSLCPYCGSSVFESTKDASKNPAVDPNVKTLSPEETLASLYPPPYRPKTIDTQMEEEEEETFEEEEEEEDVTQEEQKGAIVPTILFWLGVNVLVFSVLLLVFSNEGALYLKWNAKYWFLYSVSSFPLLFLGYKGLKNIN